MPREVYVLQGRQGESTVPLQSTCAHEKGDGALVARLSDSAMRNARDCAGRQWENLDQRAAQLLFPSGSKGARLKIHSR